MASVPQTTSVVVVSRGTRNDGERSSSSARAQGSWLSTNCDGEVDAGEPAEQPAPERPGAVVPAVDGEDCLRHGAGQAAFLAPGSGPAPVP